MTLMRLFLSWCLAGMLLLMVSGCDSSVELMASMPETDANEVLAALTNAGIKARKTPGKEGMVGLSVDAKEVGRAVDLLRTKGLPRERFSGMGEVFKKEGLISSPLEERARYIYALSQELRSTLAQIDGVLAARVHVVLPERGSGGDPNTPSSAAVFIKYQEGYNLEIIQPQIRKLVINSIPNLAADKISIVLIAAQERKTSASPAEKGEPVGMSLSPWMAGVLALLLLSFVASGFMAWKLWAARKTSGQQVRREPPS